MNIGFIGTGRITSALVEGLATCTSPPERMVVSPRNRTHAAALAKRFETVGVAATNQEVVDQCEVVFIALRSETAQEALESLSFSKAQTIISLIPTQTLFDIASWTSPATAISRAVPLPAVSRQKGPILLFEPNPVSRSILEKIGQIVIVPSEDQLHVLWAITGMVAPGFNLMTTFSYWAASKGVDINLAQTYTAQFFHAVAEMAVTHGNRDLDLLSREAATPGGLNEQASQQIHREGAYTVFVRALDALLQRFET